MQQSRLLSIFFALFAFSLFAFASPVGACVPVCITRVRPKEVRTTVGFRVAHWTATTVASRLLAIPSPATGRIKIPASARRVWALEGAGPGMHASGEWVPRAAFATRLSQGTSCFPPGTGDE